MQKASRTNCGSVASRPDRQPREATVIERHYVAWFRPSRVSHNWICAEMIAFKIALQLPTYYNAPAPWVKLIQRQLHSSMGNNAILECACNLKH